MPGQNGISHTGFHYALPYEHVLLKPVHGSIIVDTCSGLYKSDNALKIKYPSNLP